MARGRDDGSASTARVRPPVPPWTTNREGAVLIARGVTFRTASRVALVVGTILTLVNQGAIMMDGDSTVGTWVRVGVNYLVPYLVSSVGYIAPFRMRS
jgi:hypothetical protein